MMGHIVAHSAECALIILLRFLSYPPALWT